MKFPSVVSLRSFPLRAVLLASVALAGLAGCAGPRPGPDPVPADSVTYLIGPKSVVQKLYPDKSWLPPAYAGHYPDLKETIRHYTRQSLHNDNIEKAEVRVDYEVRDSIEQVRVTVTPANDVTRQYAVVHPRFLDKDHAQAALAAVEACMKAQDPTCWKTGGQQDTPWAFYLPLGMAMVNQQVVMFMNYPPVTALTDRNYLSNKTMERWNRVLAAQGMSDPRRLNTIIDSRPIAAAGSGEDSYLPDPVGWAKDQTYLRAMLALLTAPSDAASKTTRPVAVFGKVPRETWGGLVGRKHLGVLDVGETILPGQTLPTKWIVTNHPIATTYDYCTKACPAGGNCSDEDNMFVRDVQIDFIAACWMRKMAAASGTSPSAEEAKAQCTNEWVTHASVDNEQAMCVEAKLDIYDKSLQCSSPAQAEAYCRAAKNQVCARLDCSY